MSPLLSAGLSISGITLKLAFDSDNAVDDLAGRSGRFTSESSLLLVHRLRACSDAVGVGVGTILRDDPSLTVRQCEPRESGQPLRVVFDRRLRTPLTSAILVDSHPAQFFHSSLADQTTARAINETPLKRAVALGEASASGGELGKALQYLQVNWNVRHLMVEGGPTLAREFLREGLVDRCIIIRAPKVKFSNPVPSGAFQFLQITVCVTYTGCLRHRDRLGAFKVFGP